VKKIFLGPDGLRAGWRFAIFVVLWSALDTGMLLLAQRFYRIHPGMDPVDFVVSDGLGLVATFLLLAGIARFEGRRVGDYGLPAAPGFARRFAEGILWGFAPVAITMLGIAALGGVSIDGLALTGRALGGSAAVWGIAMIVLGFFEETLFRGYPLVTLARGMGFWPAAVLLSVFFGGLHYFTKPMESVLDAVSVAFIGLFVCLTFLRTGDLWLAVGFHAAFDFFALPVFGAPNTANAGLPVPGHFLATRFHGAAWLTGGPCGIEASVVMILATALLFLVFARMHPRRPSRP
jgi:membrane protease YdiL (CAAX protease family)